MCCLDVHICISFSEQRLLVSPHGRLDKSVLGLLPASCSSIGAVAVGLRAANNAADDYQVELFEGLSYQTPSLQWYCFD